MEVKKSTANTECTLLAVRQDMKEETRATFEANVMIWYRRGTAAELLSGTVGGGDAE